MSVKFTDVKTKFTEEKANASHNELENSLLSRIQAYAFGSRVPLAEDHSASSNVLFELKNNIAKLEDVSGRLDFMMDEIAGLIRRVK